MARLIVNFREATIEIDKLLGLHAGTTVLGAHHRKLIAEIALLRLFYLLENTFKAVTAKIISGTQYEDGTVPIPIAPCRSTSAALTLMENFGRTRPHQLKWSRVSEINENIRYLLHPTEHLVVTFARFGVLIDDMRRVRNRIAHNNPQARSNFRQVVRKHYGAEMNAITPGNLLLSTRAGPSMMEQYLLQSRLFLRELIKA